MGLASLVSAGGRAGFTERAEILVARTLRSFDRMARGPQMHLIARPPLSTRPTASDSSTHAGMRLFLVIMWLLLCLLLHDAPCCPLTQRRCCPPLRIGRLPKLAVSSKQTSAPPSPPSAAPTLPSAWTTLRSGQAE